MHVAGFEPTMSLVDTDYESAAFDLSAIHAIVTNIRNIILVTFFQNDCIKNSFQIIEPFQIVFSSKLKIFVIKV